MSQPVSPIFTFVLTVGLAAVLLRLALIDMKTYRLPDVYTLPLIAFGLCLAWAFPLPVLADRVIGTAAGFLSLALIGEVHFRRSGTEGLGLGDAKLFAAAGAWLGWQTLPVVLLIATTTGLIFALSQGGGKTIPIAFGPMLGLGFLLCWIGQTFS
jgi:leader peptidase (prepilin peptidase)/N-methyltransferase